MCVRVSKQVLAQFQTNCASGHGAHARALVANRMPLPGGALAILAPPVLVECSRRHGRLRSARSS